MNYWRKKSSLIITNTIFSGDDQNLALPQAGWVFSFLIMSFLVHGACHVNLSYCSCSFSPILTTWTYASVITNLVQACFSFSINAWTIFHFQKPHHSHQFCSNSVRCSIPFWWNTCTKKSLLLSYWISGFLF